MSQRWRFLGAIAIICGTIVGAGVFGIPYAVAQSGPSAGLFWFVVLGSAILCLHLLYGALQLGTNAHKRLISLVGNNLGPRFRIIPLLSTFLGAWGAMLAYLIIGGKFLAVFFGTFVNVPENVWTMLLWFFFSALIIRGTKSVTQFEIIASALLFAGLSALVVMLFRHGSLFLIPSGSPAQFFAPYGVILFSLYGANAIPEAVEIAGENRKKLALVILAGTCIPILFYVLFTFGVLSLSGASTSSEAISGISALVNPWVVKVATAVGFLAISTSFVSVGLYISDTLAYDFRTPKFFARMLAVAMPITLFLGGIRSFNLIVAVVGAILGAVDGIMISSIFFKLKSEGKITPLVYTPRVIPLVLIAIFLTGIIGEIVTLIVR